MASRGVRGVAGGAYRSLRQNHGRPIIGERTRTRWNIGLSEALFGPAPFARLVQTHALSSAGDAFFTVSLAGSLFFNVSVDAARPRILVYLLVTMAPFIVVAPLVGRAIDLRAGGPRVIVALACAGRGVACLLLARDLRDLLFFPEAFAVLVLAKSYSVARNALVPRLVENAEGLVAANAWLARTATVSSAVGGVAAAGLLRVQGPEWVLRSGAVVFAAAFGLAMFLPGPRRRPPATLPAEPERVRTPGLVRAARAMTGLRATVGFLLFLLGFALRRADEPAWFFGAVFVAGGVGALAGSVAAPWMRRRMPEERLLLLALAVPAVVALASSPAELRVGALAIAGGLGAGAAIGRQAFDSLVQRDARNADQGRAFARYETRFQLAWVLGAVIPVATRPPFWLGLLVLAVVLTLVALQYATATRAPNREFMGRPGTGR